MATSMQSVNVFEQDPELLTGVAADALPQVLERGFAPVVAYPSGTIPFAQRPQEGFGFLLLDGFLCREATVTGRTSVELMGRGDILRPWDDNRADAPVPVESAFRALESVRFATLDETFAEALAPWPEVAAAICSRLLDRARWLSLQLALTRLRRIEDRVLVLLWHLADRWGRVARDGSIICPVPLTHELVAGMIGAQRPPVSSAFARLAEEGRVAKSTEGWVLLGPPPTASALESQALADAFRLRPGS
jgi:CRP/FNR family cyclic AMP-dependent transcriptional regulator